MARARPKFRLLPPALIVLATLLFSACGDSARNTTLGASLEGQTYGRWTNLPVTLYVDAEIAADPDLMNDVREAGAFWENAAQKMLFDFRTDWSGPTPPLTGTYASPEQILANLLFFVDPWPLDGTTKGHTILSVEDEVFQNGVIYLQHSNYCVGACETPTGKLSFRRLVSHEFGHFLGLNHAADSADVMYPSIPRDAPLATATHNDAALQSIVR